MKVAIRKLKNKDGALIVAPHPCFYSNRSAGSRLVQNTFVDDLGHLVAANEVVLLPGRSIIRLFTFAGNRVSWVAKSLPGWCRGGLTREIGSVVVVQVVVLHLHMAGALLQDDR